MTWIGTIVGGLGPLLAQLSNWSRLGDRFSGDYLRLRPEHIIGTIVVLVLGVGGFWLLNFLSEWQRTAATRKCPKRLFGELALAHRLTRGEQKKCRQLAADRGLADPAELFVRTDLKEPLAAVDPELARRVYGAGA